MADLRCGQRLTFANACGASCSVTCAELSNGSLQIDILKEDGSRFGCISHDAFAWLFSHLRGFSQIGKIF
jgi:hypothetical protein